MKFANIRQLKTETKSILEKARKEDVIVTYRGKPWVLILKMNEDTLEDYILTHHPRFRRLLLKSLHEEMSGKVKPLSKIAEELGVEL